MLVTGTGPNDRLQTVSRDATRAIGQVRALWGTNVLRGTVRIEVPADDNGFRSLGGANRRNGPESAQVAATTTPDGRVVLSPQVFDDLTAEGVVVVLAHELTHVALGQATLTGVPRWVIEGSAELTAFKPTGLSLAQAAPKLAGQVRAGQVPAAPPADPDFAESADAAYQGAYAWSRFLHERYGSAKFTRFVRAADARRHDAFFQAFGVEPSELGVDYQQFLRDAVGPADPSSASSSGR